MGLSRYSTSERFNNLLFLFCFTSSGVEQNIQRIIQEYPKNAQKISLVLFFFVKQISETNLQRFRLEAAMQIDAAGNRCQKTHKNSQESEEQLHRKESGRLKESLRISKNLRQCNGMNLRPSIESAEHPQQSRISSMIPENVMQRISESKKDLPSRIAPPKKKI